ncbi:MAG: hypothetical protein UZ09_BCD002001664 [Bacteroidetes bacterium OLB9]|nr:MAG: hypothetical protein UZ09_BCD002001664 [Bacteroidetes bacterium OLB9]
MSKLEDSVKTTLIEDLVTHHIESAKLPPLAAKIFSFILVNDRPDGFTFDELVDTFHVSKSSVSTNLNLLVQYDFLIQFNKIGERKRRYKLTSQYLEIRLKKIRKDLIREKYLVEKLVQFHQDAHSTFHQDAVIKTSIYIEHLDYAIKNLTKTINKIDKITHSI